MPPLSAAYRIVNDLVCSFKEYFFHLKNFENLNALYHHRYFTI